jgi:uncharacterized membrane protein YeiH
MQRKSVNLLYAVDLAGTFLFAIEGASAAIASKLDLLGVMVLAFATALGGGIIRDVLIGSVPPNALRDWRYSATAFTGASITFFLNGFVQAIPAQVIMVLDAAGLALFAVAGTEKALLFEMPPLIAVLLGGITGVGGGTIRDVLLAKIPNVLRADVYATADLSRRGGHGHRPKTRSLPIRVGIPRRLALFSIESHKCLASLESSEVAVSLPRVEVPCPYNLRVVCAAGT